ncbi:MAG: protein phosphatase 2C domain-containing protein [Deltaproteobacteria bacterium]|jgi:hypothetical protein|nr:protein phosphatase 2C domain-containing protein [Deltaproteobacteria bacterium]
MAENNEKTTIKNKAKHILSMVKNDKFLWDEHDHNSFKRDVTEFLQYLIEELKKDDDEAVITTVNRALDFIVYLSTKNHEEMIVLANDLKKSAKSEDDLFAGKIKILKDSISNDFTEENNLRDCFNALNNVTWHLLSSADDKKSSDNECPFGFTLEKHDPTTEENHPSHSKSEELSDLTDNNQNTKTSTANDVISDNSLPLETEKEKRKIGTETTPIDTTVSNDSLTQSADGHSTAFQETTPRVDAIDHVKSSSEPSSNTDQKLTAETVTTAADTETARADDIDAQTTPIRETNARYSKNHSEHANTNTGQNSSIETNVSEREPVNVINMAPTTVANHSETQSDDARAPAIQEPSPMVDTTSHEKTSSVTGANTDPEPNDETADAAPENSFLGADDLDRKTPVPETNDSVFVNHSERTDVNLEQNGSVETEVSGRETSVHEISAAVFENLTVGTNSNTPEETAPENLFDAVKNSGVDITSLFTAVTKESPAIETEKEESINKTDDEESENIKIKKHNHKINSEYNEIFHENKPVIAVLIEIDSTVVLKDIFKKIGNSISKDGINANYKTEIDYSINFNLNKYVTITGIKANNFLKNKLELNVLNVTKDNVIDKNLIRIVGKPNAIGYNDEEESLTILVITLNKLFHYKTFKMPFFISPDPKTMWKNLPVPENLVYRASDEAHGHEKLAGTDKSVYAASVRGRSHAHEGKSRDDNFRFLCNHETGWNFFAVSDGAGSARFSRKGSEIACVTAVSKLNELFDVSYTDYLISRSPTFVGWKEFLQNNHTIDESRSNTTNAGSDNHGYDLMKTADNKIIEVITEVHANIEKEASAFRQDKATMNDYHATLLLTAIKKFDFGYFVVSFQIGDGGMLIYKWDKKDGIHCLGKPDSGEFAGQTLFVTMGSEINGDAIKKRTDYFVVDDFEALIMATDGITDPFFESDNALKSYAEWERFYETVLKRGFEDNKGCPELFSDETSPDEKSRSLLEWTNFYIKGHHDDRTILIIK